MEITVDGLKFSYNGAPLLDGLDLTVPKGEVLAIVGPNGSGKTTLLKNISGILSPEVGSVYLDMTRLPELSITELARYLAVVEQEREIGFDFTVREIVALGRLPPRAIRKRDQDRQAVDRESDEAYQRGSLC